MTVRDQIMAILARQALIEVSEISPDSTPEALGIDSMGMVEAIFAIEEAFDISVPFSAGGDAEGEGDLTVGHLIAAVEKLIGAPAA